MAKPVWMRPILAALLKLDAWRSRAPWWINLVVAVLSTSLGALVRLAFLGGSTPKLAYLTFYPVVSIAALIGGAWGGSLAAILSALLVHSVFVPLIDATDWLALAMFLASCALIVGVTELLQFTRASAMAAQVSQTAQGQLAAIVEASSDAILSKRLDRTITSWNAGATRIFGYSAEEMIGQSIDRIIPPELVDEEAKILERLKAGEGIEHYETIRLARDGRRLDVSLTISPLYDASGQVIGASKIIRDVSARKRAERRLLESEARKSFLLELADALRTASESDEIKYVACAALGLKIGGNRVLFAEIDPTDTFATISRDWSDGSMASNAGPHRLADYGPQLIADLRAGNTVVIDDVKLDPRTCAPEALATFRARNIAGVMSVPLIRAGRLVWVLSVQSNRARHWSAFEISLTEEVAARSWEAVVRARAEQALRERDEALRESEKKFRRLADAIPNLAWIADADGSITWYNQRWFEYTGTTPEQMHGWGWKSVHDPDVLPAVMERWTLSIATGKPFGMTFPLRGADGRFRPFLTRVMPLLDVQGKALQWFGTNTEIAEQKEMEEELRHARAEAERANLAKSKFLAAASHDLRQPVQSLTLLISMLERQVADKPKAASIVALAKTSMDSLSAMLTGILDISRLDAGVIAPTIASVDLGDLVERLAREYGPRASDIGLRLRIFPRALHASTDAALFERIMRNLIENALRYTEQGGILLGVRRRGEKVRLDVIDTGQGIPADQQTEIFEEFRQLDNPARDSSKGLGLGLAIVSRLARLLAAEVQVCSRPGRGSRFSVLLPASENAPAAQVAREALADPGGRVLIVEDNANVRHAYEMMLVDWGYATLSAASGEEALDRIALENWRFDAVIADHRLGPGLTGAATATEISRRAGRAIPTMLVTGDTDEERLTEIAGSGFTLLHKPVEADDLRRALAGLLRG